MTDITLKFRNVNTTDVMTIVQMLSDDPLGSKREKFEDPLPESYFDAFESISEDPNNELVVATITQISLDFYR